MNKIFIPNWFQVDFRRFEDEHIYHTLVKVFILVRLLKNRKLISKWFFLYEGDTIRVRFETRKNRILKTLIDQTCETNLLKTDKEWKFEKYWEMESAFENVESILAFAAIMHSVSELVMSKESESVKFDNYRFVERISHCIYNAVYGTPTEEAFLARRLKERLSLVNTNDSLIDLCKDFYRNKTMEGR